MGKHPRNALAPSGVAKLKPGKYADGLGLYLVVDPSSARRWVLRLTVNRTRRELGLGGYPTVSLALAREQTIRLRRIAKEGGNPEMERDRKTRTVPSFEQCAIDAHAEYSRKWRSKKHAQQWITTLQA